MLGYETSTLSTSDTNDPENKNVAIPADADGEYYVLFIADDPDVLLRQMRIIIWLQY